jgi:ribonuclease G
MDSLRAPVVVYREQSLVAKLLRDLLTDDYTAIRIDSYQEFQRVQDLVERMMPSLSSKVKHYNKHFPIFEEYGVQAELDKALRSKVWLKSGGSIVINQTEALVAVDVNTGRYVGKRTSGRLEDTIVKTNLEAAKEIVRQIRLRDLGGIIVLDFIDMEEKKNRQKVAQAVEQELRRDRAPSEGAGLDFGLIVVTRKRVKRSLERVLTEPCPCSGAAIKSARRSATDPGGSEEAQHGSERPWRRAAREPGHRAGAEGRGKRRAARPAAGARPPADAQAGRAPASRRV